MIAIKRIAEIVAVALFAGLIGAGAAADSAQQIHTKSEAALEKLRGHAGGAQELLRDAAGVLVFPDVVKIGFGAGGQYGEGVLLIDGSPDSFYTTAGSSFGLQLGAQFKSEVIVFRSPEALQKFRDRRGWEVGVDGNVAILELGAGGGIDSRQLNTPVVGSIFSNEGLMYNLTFEGSKITRIAR